MESTVTNAALLSVVGMVTVFIVLLIVTTGGSILIKLVNRFSPDEKKQPRGIIIHNKKIAVITAAVDIITMGKGVIDEIEPIE